MLSCMFISCCKIGTQGEIKENCEINYYINIIVLIVIVVDILFYGFIVGVS